MTWALAYGAIGFVLACRAAYTQFHSQPLERFLLAVGVAVAWPLVLAVELPQEIREWRYQRKLDREFGDPS